MNGYEDAMRENQALRERMAVLSAAILRINASLDLDAVLREVVEAALELTGARIGIVTTFEVAGGPFGESFISGTTPAESQELATWPDRTRLFAHLLELPGPLRVANLGTYVSNLGITPTAALSRTFQATPMRYGGNLVGHFFLAEKADGEEFSDADEEVAVLFAAQAAIAIGNARTHRAEQRARTHFETLVDVSPVGVALLDAKSGRVESANREVRRLAEKLGVGDPNELLEVLSFRRAQGDEVSLGGVPVAERFVSGETLRAEEMDISVPGGVSMRVLVDAIPIRDPDGGIASVVMAAQDLAPLDEIERRRTEFLALVGHELRQPLTSIKGSADTLLEEDLDIAEMREFHRIIADQAGQMRRLVGDLLDAGRIEAGTLSVTPEPSEVANLVEQARTAFAASGGRHTVQVDLPAGPLLAMADRRRIEQVLGNLLANAAKHAPQSTPIRIAAKREDGRIAVSVSDEGKGIAPELLPHVFSKGTTGRDAARHGLGLAICKGLVEAHGGRIRAASDGLGRGATLTFTLPAAAIVSGDIEPARTGSYAQDPSEGSRVLVVDDDPRTLRFVRNALSAAGFKPLVTGTSEDLQHVMRTEKPRLVLLDLMLPGADGIQLMELVPELLDVPVIFISGYGRDETVARALNAGAADYIVKPFSPTELVARVRTALRNHDGPGPFTLGDLAVDYARRRVTVAGEAVDLTATEFDLLQELCRAAGRVVTHETLLRRIWGDREDTGPNLIRIFVRNLRRKLGDDAANPTYVLNQRGVGYRVPDPASW